MRFVGDLMIYLGVVLFVITLLALYVFAKVDYDWQRFKAHWSTTGRGAAGGIVIFVGTLALAALLAYSVNAQAAPAWFQYTEIYAGIDRTYQPSPQCVRNTVDDHLTSNGGVRQHIYSFSESVSLSGAYTHHSCAVGVDAAGYDAIGVQLSWRFVRE